MGKSLEKKSLDKHTKSNSFRFSFLVSRFSFLVSRFSLLAFTFFVFIFSSHINAQVIIKEKVEINPQSVIVPDNPNSNSHSMSVEVNWDAQEVQANGHFWNANLQVNTQLTNNCDQVVGATGFVFGWPTGSSILNIQNVNSYYYTLRVTLTGFYGAYQSVDVNYSIYFDDELLHSGLIEAMSGLDYTWTVTRYYEQTIYVFLVDFLDFKINTNNYPVEYKNKYNLYTNPSNSCSSSNVVSLTDSLNLSIIQGSQYLTFFQNQTEDTLGSSTQTILSDLNNIKLLYNKPLRDTLDTLGVIMIEGNGLVEYDSVKIKPALFDLIVETEPKIIAPGDTAIVTVKRRTDYGTEEFPSDQSFDVWIIEGSSYGFLLDSLTGNSGSSLTGIPNRFRIVANDSIDVDSAKIEIKVITETGNISTSLTGNNTKQNETNKIDSINVHNKEPIQSDWIDFGETLEGYGNVVVKEDSCDEEIVVCDSFEPQKFDDPGVGKIEKLISNAPWNWIDPVTKTPKNTDAGEGCNRGKSSTDVGLTYVMSEIGPFSQSTPSVIYQLSEDIIIEACLDDRNPNEKLWRFKIKNVRVPIFVDVCSTFISNRNFIDLGDATDFSLLGSHITNCIEFRKVLADLDWEISGGDYSFPCVIRTSKYLFSTAIREHEEKHFQDKTYYIKKELDENTLLQLQQMTRKKDDYPCPEAVLGPDNSGKTKRELFKSLISARIIKGANIDLHMGTSPVPCGIPPSMPVYFQFNSELEANKSTKKFVLASLFGGKCNLGMIRCIS